MINFRICKGGTLPNTGGISSMPEDVRIAFLVRHCPIGNISHKRARVRGRLGDGGLGSHKTSYGRSRGRLVRRVSYPTVCNFQQQQQQQLQRPSLTILLRRVVV